MWDSKVIRSRVMAHINNALDAAEKEYQDGCVAIDEQAEANKMALQDQHVTAILGKLM